MLETRGPCPSPGAKHPSRPRSLLATLGLLWLGACGSAETASSAQAQDTAAPFVGFTGSVDASDVPLMQPLSVQAQGTQLQGMQLQGTQLQGRQLQGTQLQGVQLQGMQLQGTTLSGVTVGRTLTGSMSDGSTVVLTIGGIETDPYDASGETTLYTVLYRNPDTGALENICPPDRAGVQRAVAVSGTWDATGAHASSTSHFTLGCTSGVIAKCVRWGYKPWKTVDGQSLADHHQACTRMARADYCGDGVSHTIDGTWIDVYDKLGIQMKTKDSGMLFEASWSTAGATCVSKPRWYGLLTVMDTAAIPRTLCEGRVAVMSFGEVVDPDETECDIRPARGRALMRNDSYINVVTP